MAFGIQKHQPWPSFYKEDKNCCRFQIPRKDAANSIFSNTKALLSCIVANSLKSSAEGEAQATAELDDIFEMVGNKLSGRRYLVGETFSVADLCFASLSVPILYPDEFKLQKKFFADKRLPQAFKDIVNRYRATPAGQYALRLYREDRYVNGIPRS